MKNGMLRMSAQDYGKKPNDDDRFKTTLDLYETASIDLMIKDWLDSDEARGIQDRTKNTVKIRNRIGAQAAFGKLFNCYNAWDRRYARYDHYLTLWVDGTCVKKSVDVKYTGFDDGILCANLDTPKRGIRDMYALMFGGFPTYWFRGCVPGEVFIVESNIEVKWGQRQYVMEQKKLSLEFFF